MRAHRAIPSLLLGATTILAACGQLIGDHIPDDSTIVDADVDVFVSDASNEATADATSEMPNPNLGSSEATTDIAVESPVGPDEPDGSSPSDADAAAADADAEGADRRVDATNGADVDAPYEATTDAGGDAAMDGSGESDAPLPCTQGTAQCDETGRIVQTCNDAGSWINSSNICSNFCMNGGCTTPISCLESNANICGPGNNEPCCAARLVPHGSFYRSFDGVDFTDQNAPATIDDVMLDIYEVSVSRFRAFVQAYDSWTKPSSNSGQDINSSDPTGWDSANWGPLLPADAGVLQQRLACQDGTWTPQVQTVATESVPINCVDWYTAFAFCIWDGGRLPTEAEWNYAAAGGSDQRVYPWSNPPTSALIDSMHAVYASAGPAIVGSLEAYDSGAKWGHWDMAGNVDEWVFDTDAPYPVPCSNCAATQATGNRMSRGGNWQLASFLDYQTTSLRTGLPADSISPQNGMRCARQATR